MVAGRELDERIHVDLMGLELLPFKDAPCPYCGDEMRYCGERSRCTTCGEWRYGPAKEYSDDITAAWEVVEKIGPLRLEKFSDGWYAQFGSRQDDRRFTAKAGVADTAPLAICLAALSAVGLPVTQEEG